MFVCLMVLNTTFNTISAILWPIQRHPEHWTQATVQSQKQNNAKQKIKKKTSNNDPCSLVKVLSVLEEIEKKPIYIKGGNIHCQNQPVCYNDQNVCFNQGIHY